MKELIRQKKTWERLMNNQQKEMKILNESGNYDKDISEWIRYKCMNSFWKKLVLDNTQKEKIFLRMTEKL